MIIAASEECGDLGLLHLDTNMLNEASDSESGKNGNHWAQNIFAKYQSVAGQRMETSDQELNLSLWWDVCEIPSDLGLMPEGKRFDNIKDDQ
jgi:hypothetical protein